MIFAIGDIHGRADMLARMLDHIRPKIEQGDLVVFLGDYIDRGMESKQVIDLLLSWKQDHKDTIFLLGNHDQMLIDCLIAEAPRQQDGGTIVPGCMQNWFLNGGWHTLLSYGFSGDYGELVFWKDLLPQNHLDFFLRLPTEYKTEKFHFVHAGLPEPGMPNMVRDYEGEPEYDYRLWARDKFIESETDWGRRVVAGHNIQASGQPRVMPNKVLVDTGCGCGGPLSCVVLDPVDELPVRRYQIKESK